MFLFLQLKNGNLQYISDAGVAGKVERTLADVPLSDGLWHTLMLQKNGTSTSLRLDGTNLRVIPHTTQDFGGVNVLTMSIGGIPAGPAQPKSSPG